MKNGLYIVYSQINQAWFVMWYNEVLRVRPTKKDAQYWLNQYIAEIENANDQSVQSEREQ